MKKIFGVLSILIAVVLVVCIAEAKLTSSLKSNYVYASNQKDTVVAPAALSVFNRVSLIFVSDTVDIKIYMDTRVIGASSWSVKDSTTVSGNGTQRAEWVLRDNTTEKIAGCEQEVRFRHVFQSSGNAVGSKRYSSTLKYIK